jgi:hypothetical protein
LIEKNIIMSNARPKFFKPGTGGSINSEHETFALAHIKDEIDGSVVPPVDSDPEETISPTTADSAPVANLIDNENSSLAQVADYFLNPAHLTSLKDEFKKQLFLFIVAVSGCAVYALPADKYADEEYDHSVAMRVLFVICTCLPAFGFLNMATDTFLQQRKKERSIPLALNDILQSPLTPFQQNMKDAGIVVGAALSAVPFTVVSIVYPLPFLPRVVSWLQSAVVGIDNTILHFWPVFLAFQNPFYRFPTYIFESMYAKIKYFRMTAEQRTEKENKAKLAQLVGELKGGINRMLGKSLNNLALHGMNLNTSSLLYELDLPDDIHSLLDSRTLPLSKLLALANFHPAASKAEDQQQGRWDRAGVDKVMLPLIYVLGALWVITSCAGYLAAPINQLVSITGSTIGGTIGAVTPSYFFLVLLAWIGGNSLQGVYHYLTHWGEQDVKLPLEFKIYPKTFMFLTLLDAFFASFSYGASNQTIKDNFEGDLAPLVPALLVLSETGISFVGFIGLFNVYSNLLNKYAQYFGNEEAREIVLIKNMIISLMDSLPLIKANELLESLEELPEEQLIALTGLPRNKFEVMQTNVNRLSLSIEEKEPVKEDSVVALDIHGSMFSRLKRSGSLNIDSSDSPAHEQKSGGKILLFSMFAKPRQHNKYPVPSPPDQARSLSSFPPSPH